MSYTYAEVDGAAKTGLIYQMALAGAEREPLVRATAIRLVYGLGRTDHIARLRRLHEFVRDSIDYVGEPIEMLHSASVTLHLGAGDCDDHAILLGALAWSLKYPFAVRPIAQDPEYPEHYSMAIGYPQSHDPLGSADTRWIDVETTIPAHTGEPVERAARRLTR